MKKSTKLIVALLVVVAALAVTYRLMHRVPSADLEANAQMQQIITDAGCLRCHTSTPDLPFYASMPVAGKIVMEDVSKAYRAFDMTQMEADLEAGQPLNPADLAKIEKVILDYKKPEETGLPAANVLIYSLDNGATVVVRPSGTEPKIKTYFTTLGKDLADAQAQKDALAAAIEPILA